MGKISVLESVTLDGVMQGLGRPDEDTRGGFVHGGWGPAYTDHVAGEFMAEGMAQVGAMLFGRRTYEDVLGYWTTTPEQNPFTDVLVNTPKFVVSGSADTTLAYPNSTLLTGDATSTVAGLTSRVEGDITVIGSGELVRTLHAAGLVDEYVLQIHPIVLGSGTKLFAPGDRRDLTLQRSVTTTTGVIIAVLRQVSALSVVTAAPSALVTARGSAIGQRSQPAFVLRAPLTEVRECRRQRRMRAAALPNSAFYGSGRRLRRRCRRPHLGGP